MRPAIPMNEAAERYSPEIAAALTDGDTSRAATMKSAGVCAIRIPRAPTPTVSSITAAMAPTEASSLIRVRSVHMVYQADELSLQAIGLVVIEGCDDQDDREYADAQRNQSQRHAQDLRAVERWQHSTQDRE